MKLNINFKNKFIQNQYLDLKKKKERTTTQASSQARLEREQRAVHKEHVPPRSPGQCSGKEGPSVVDGRGSFKDRPGSPQRQAEVGVGLAALD